MKNVNYKSNRKNILKEYEFCKLLRGNRICHPQICYFGI